MRISDKMNGDMKIMDAGVLDQLFDAGKVDSYADNSSAKMICWRTWMCWMMFA
uniref:Uncharacterized protein n=1 Tax=Arundo donax TaxID=35708 RepID=A0A0A9DBN2_ARUDO